MSEPVTLVLEKLRKVSLNIQPEDCIFESEVCPGQPLGETFFRNAIARELERLGIPGKWHGKSPEPEDYVNEQKRRNLVFHSMRHDFVTLAQLAGVSDLEVEEMAGHKSPRMRAKYSHAKQVIDFEKVRGQLEHVIGA
jgi:integrase